MHRKHELMMNKNLLFFCFLLIASVSASAAKWPTPNTGVHYTLDSLVARSNGVVTLTNGEYFINDTVEIRSADTLSILTDAVVRFAPGSYLWVNKGSIRVNPSNNVLFTALDQSAGFLGVRIDSSSNASFAKLTFEYAVSFRLSDCSPTFNGCTFQFNNVGTSTSFGNGAMSLFRSSPVISNCQFLYNRRAAVQGGANISNAPKIFNSVFKGNNTTGQNVPQINLGASSVGGVDTVKIIDNQIIDAGSTNAGGIGFLPVGEVYAIIKGNTIRNNRYGLTFNGAQNIHALVSFNVIEDNNIQNNPNLGGSGISFTGGSAGSIGQQVVVYSNIFKGNLWGITIQGRSKPNLGDLTNTDTTDDGWNHFINNTNASTPGIDLYNNAPDDVMAQNNYWNTDLLSEVEGKIFHFADNSTLGTVNYEPFLTSTILPAQLTNFTVKADGESALLSWQTLNEENTSHFNIQRSFNGKEFSTVATVAAAGNSHKTLHYSYTDVMQANMYKHYYRLELVDKDGAKKYSAVRLLTSGKAYDFNFYPNPAKEYIVVDAKEAAAITIADGSGRVLLSRATASDQQIIPVSQLATGTYYISVRNASGVVSTKKLVIQ